MIGFQLFFLLLETISLVVRTYVGGLPNDQHRYLARLDPRDRRYARLANCLDNLSCDIGPCNARRRTRHVAAPARTAARGSYRRVVVAPALAAVVALGALLLALPVRVTAAAQAASAALHVPVLTTAPELTGDGGWGDAAHAQIAWDFTNNRPAIEPADVDIAAAGGNLYVSFHVRQRQPITASQALDNVG